MGLRVFVTRELFPFTAGGIGRVVANILATSSEEERAGIAVLFVGDGVDAAAFNAVYPGARFMSARERDYVCVDEWGRLYPPKHAFSTSWLHWESVLVLQALRNLERREGSLNYIEFVDWGAAGFAATQEKRLGQGFRNTTLAVRLHTTDSVLAAYEKRAPDVHGLALYDLERKALADCDMIVGQLAPVADAMRCFYAFSEEEWCTRLVIHAPPVLLDAVPRAESTVALGAETPLVFSSKLQDIKRPDVFVQGCVEFMLANPGYTGEARFMAHAFDPAYQARIEGLVPKTLAGRFLFMRGVSGLARERVIAGSVCIFPSPWESFCLAAHEASMSGALCVLNYNNPAFGDLTPWIDGTNCYTFDGTPSGLAVALARAFRQSMSSSLEPVQLPADAAPWKRLTAASAVAVDSEDLTVVIVHHGDGADLIATLDSVAASSCVPASVVVVDDGSRDPLSKEVLDRIEQSDAPLQVLRLADRRGTGAAFNAALQRVSTPLVGFVSGGSVISPDFLSAATIGLACSPGFDLVTGQQGYGTSLEELAQAGPRDPWRYWVVHGEARASGHVQNRYASDTFVVRTSHARSRDFDETLGDRAPWEFLLASIAMGARSLVWPCICVVRRSATAIDDSAGRHAWSAPVAYGDLLAGKQVGYGKLRLPAYAFATGRQGVAVAAYEQEYKQLYMELRSSETVRAALFFAGFLQRQLPWLLAALRRLMPLAVRVRGR